MSPTERAGPSDSPIVAEIRSIREKIESDCGHDLDRQIEQLRVIERQHKARLLPPVDRGQADPRVRRPA